MVVGDVLRWELVALGWVVGVDVRVTMIESLQPAKRRMMHAVAVVTVEPEPFERRVSRIATNAPNNDAATTSKTEVVIAYGSR